MRLCVALVSYCEACGTTSFDLQWILKQFVGLFPIVISVSYVYSSVRRLPSQKSVSTNSFSSTTMTLAVHASSIRSSVFSLRSSIFKLRWGLTGLLSCFVFFCHSPFGKMTFIYLRLVSVKIALVFLPVSLRFPSSLLWMICRWWGAFVLGDIEHFLLLLLLLLLCFMLFFTPF